MEAIHHQKDTHKAQASRGRKDNHTAKVSYWIKNKNGIKASQRKKDNPQA